MPSSPSWKLGRTATHSARQILIRDGYEVIRNADPHGFVDLIAWKDRSDLLFVRVKSTRTAGVTASHYQNEIAHLVELIANLPGDLELWIKSHDLWSRYRILRGGAVAIGGIVCEEK